MPHVGRNDPCPCGSGRKYKHCHMGKAPEQAASDVFPFPTVNETFVVGSLLAFSPAFRATYNTERPTITAPLGWTQHLPMPPEIVAQAIHLPNAAAKVLYIRRIPPEASAAPSIAHELLHLVLDAEGFPQLATQPERSQIAALLNNLVQDPLISTRMQAHGFPIEQKLLRDLAIAQASMQGVASPTDPMLRQLWVLNVAAQILECRAIASAAVATKRSALESWFHQLHPSLAREAEHLLHKVVAIGYETPERMLAFFDWAAQEYELPAP